MVPGIGRLLLAVEVRLSLRQYRERGLIGIIRSCIHRDGDSNMPLVTGIY